MPEAYSLELKVEKVLAKVEERKSIQFPSVIRENGLSLWAKGRNLNCHRPKTYKSLLYVLSYPNKRKPQKSGQDFFFFF